MKRCGRLRHRSKTNSHSGEDLLFRREYAEENLECELGRWFPNQFSREDSTECHHIMTGRRDLRTNLLMVCRDAHAWCEEFKADGRVLALFVKHSKGELDLQEFRLASGFHLPGWLLMSESKIRHDFVRPFLNALIELYP